MTFKTKYADYPNCEFRACYYGNGNRALRVESLTEGPICICSVNPGVPVPDDCIAIKDYSENAGMVHTLKQMGIIDRKVDEIPSGFVTIPVYTLTPAGLDLWEREEAHESE